MKKKKKKKKRKKDFNLVLCCVVVVCCCGVALAVCPIVLDVHDPSVLVPPRYSYDRLLLLDPWLGVLVCVLAGVVLLLDRHSQF